MSWLGVAADDGDFSISLVNQHTTIPTDYSKSTLELFFRTLDKAIQTEWAHETKNATTIPDELRKALGLDDTAVHPNFVRCFVPCGIKFQTRILTLEKWFEFSFDLYQVSFELYNHYRHFRSIVLKYIHLFTYVHLGRTLPSCRDLQVLFSSFQYFSHKHSRARFHIRSNVSSNE